VDVRAGRGPRDAPAAARSVDVDAVKQAIARRDSIDSSRAVSPLTAAPDAVQIDTTSRDVDDIVAEIVDRFRWVMAAQSPAGEP
jgi:cytidylate kinase